MVWEKWSPKPALAGEARTFAGRADMFFDFWRHVDLSGRLS